MATVLGPWSWSKKRARKVDEKYLFKEYLEEEEEEGGRRGVVAAGGPRPVETVNGAPA